MCYFDVKKKNVVNVMDRRRIPLPSLKSSMCSDFLFVSLQTFLNNVSKNVRKTLMADRLGYKYEEEVRVHDSLRRISSRVFTCLAVLTCRYLRLHV